MRRYKITEYRRVKVSAEIAAQSESEAIEHFHNERNLLTTVETEILDSTSTHSLVLGTFTPKRRSRAAIPRDNGYSSQDEAG